MSTSHDLVAALKAELKAAGVTYAALAQQLGMSESSIKRVFARADMPLSRVDDVLRVLMLVHGQLNPGQASSFIERLQRVGSDFAQQHLADQKLLPSQRRAYTLIVGMRSWLFAAFRDLPRDPSHSVNRP